MHCLQIALAGELKYTGRIECIMNLVVVILELGFSILTCSLPTDLRIIVVRLTVCLSVRMSVCMDSCLSVCLFLCLSYGW